MSNGDDETADAEAADEAATEEAESEAETEAEGELAVSFEERLNEAESTLEAAETEAILDEVEETLDEIAADLEAAEFPEPEEPEDEEEEAEDPREQLEERLEDLRAALEDKRGPYTEDVAEIVTEAAGTVRDTRWTDAGREEAAAAVESYLETASEDLDESFAAEGDLDALADELDAAATALEESDLDPDDDAETIADLLEAAESLTDDLQAAEEWDDLTIQGQLDHEGFYDVLSSSNRKDFPPEWSAVKTYEKQNEPEPILFALDRLDSDFMEENILETLKRMAPEEAFEEMNQRAQKRNKLPVEILGKIGDERALETLHDFIEGDGDPALQKVTLRAIGEIGSEESTQAVANRLAADNYEVRSAAARALGLIGDTRAIDPLADVLADDEADEVRASAAWALNQIGTGRALDVVSAYTDDRAYIVQAEAEKAV